ncbi:MAG: putative peroxidase-related enzyme [Planctomycetota bacterium]
MIALGADWRGAELSEVDQALCVFAEDLTRKPASMGEHHLDALRAHGLDDTAIHDAIQVVAYFNYINRLADATHVDLEEDMFPYGVEIGAMPMGPETSD